MRASNPFVPSYMLPQLTFLVNTYVIHFTLQYMFVLLVLPCLVLAYLGQAAFLIANPKSSEQVFFSSIPSKLNVADHLA
jgi:hypothetical protein